MTLRRIIPLRLQLWIRQSVPKKRASFKDLLDGVRNQAISVALLTVVSPAWTLLVGPGKSDSNVLHYLSRWMYGFWVAGYACGALVLLLLSVYQTVHAFEQASFLNPKNKIKLKGRTRLALIFWIILLVFSVPMAGFALLMATWKS